MDRSSVVCKHEIRKDLRRAVLVMHQIVNELDVSDFFEDPAFVQNLEPFPGKRDSTSNSSVSTLPFRDFRNVAG